MDYFAAHPPRFALPASNSDSPDRPSLAPMSGERLDVRSRRAGETVEVVADGELDMASAPVLVEHTEAQLEGDDRARVVLDLSGVSFIDSTGLRALLNLSEQQPERVTIVPSPACSRLFEIAGLKDWLPLADGAGEQ
jgi:anti-anti-sigma factor